MVSAIYDIKKLGEKSRILIIFLTPSTMGTIMPLSGMIYWVISGPVFCVPE